MGDRLVAGDRAVAPPSVAAKPELVVAIAWKPSEANSFAEPASHAFGITSGVPGTCRARKVARTSSVVMSPSWPRRPAAERGSAIDATVPQVAASLQGHGVSSP